MFVDHSNEAALEAAIDAGIAAYVVDGFAKGRIKPVLELAVRRFNAFSQLRDELEEAKSALAARNMLDAAKALLIKKRKIDEAAAYALLRKLAMDQGRKITDVAEALLTSEKILNGFE
jgi:response regulator NasT